MDNPGTGGEPPSDLAASGWVRKRLLLLYKPPGPKLGDDEKARVETQNDSVTDACPRRQRLQD